MAGTTLEMHACERDSVRGVNHPENPDDDDDVLCCVTSWEKERASLSSTAPPKVSPIPFQPHKVTKGFEPLTISEAEAGLKEWRLQERNVCLGAIMNAAQMEKYAAVGPSGSLTSKKCSPPSSERLMRRLKKHAFSSYFTLPFYVSGKMRGKEPFFTKKKNANKHSAPDFFLQVPGTDSQTFSSRKLIKVWETVVAVGGEAFSSPFFSRPSILDI